MNVFDFIRLKTQPVTIKQPPPMGYVDIFIDPESGDLVIQKPDSSLIKIKELKVKTLGDLAGELSEEDLKELIDDGS